MNRFVHVGFNFGTRVKILEIEPVFTAIGEDWVRYSPLCWILWTSKPSPHIYTLLAPHLDASDNCLVAALTNDMFGLLTPWIWEWMQSKKPESIVRGEAARQTMLLPAAQLKPFKD
jgi:hypothetical protein